MDYLKSAFDTLSDSRISCSCAAGEAVRTSLAVDALGHHYGWWVGEVLCFVLYAQKKLFMHYVGALYCFFGMLGASSERNGFLAMHDSFASLALDVPRLLLALYLLAKFHTFCAFFIRSCCGYRDDWSMGTRLGLIRQADHQLERMNQEKESIRTLIRVARKTEYDRLFEFLLISPRWVWNGWPFGRIRNGRAGKAFLFVSWAIYIVPFALRLTLITASTVVGADVCGPLVAPVHRFVSALFAFVVLFYCLVVVPISVHRKTFEEAYF